MAAFGQPSELLYLEYTSNKDGMTFPVFLALGLPKLAFGEAGRRRSEIGGLWAFARITHPVGLLFHASMTLRRGRTRDLVLLQASERMSVSQNGPNGCLMRAFTEMDMAANITMGARPGG